MVVAVVRGRCFDRSRITSFLCSVNRKMLHFLGVTVILGILSVRPFPLHSSTRLAFVCYRYLLRCKLFFISILMIKLGYRSSISSVCFSSDLTVNQSVLRYRLSRSCFTLWVFSPLLCSVGSLASCTVTFSQQLGCRRPRIFLTFILSGW